MAFLLARRHVLAGSFCALLGSAASAQDFGRPLSLPTPSVSVRVPDGVADSVPKPKARWQLRKGALVHEELRVWAQLAGWEFRWHPGMTWNVVADTAFPGEFADAISRVIEALYREGHPVRLVLWEGNQVAEVVSNDVR